MDVRVRLFAAAAVVVVMVIVMVVDARPSTQQPRALLPEQDHPLLEIFYIPTERVRQLVCPLPGLRQGMFSQRLPDNLATIKDSDPAYVAADDVLLPHSSAAGSSPLLVALTPRHHHPSSPQEGGSHASRTTPPSTSFISASTSRASTNASLPHLFPWRLITSVDGIVTLEELEDLLWDVTRPLKSLRKRWRWVSNPFLRRDKTPQQETILSQPDHKDRWGGADLCPLRRDRRLHRHTRDTHDDDEGFVSAIVQSFSADGLWVKLVSDQFISFFITLKGSLSFYLLYLVGLGHLLSTGEIVGVLWTVYDIKAVFIQWLVSEGYVL